MNRKATLKDLVIDANVACSSGDKNAVHPTSIKCRDFLLAVESECYSIVITSEIYREWRNRASSFATGWLKKMKETGRIFEPEPKNRDDIFGKINHYTFNDSDIAEIRKDLHLLEAALSAGERIVTKDKKLFSRLQRAISTAEELKVIVWVDPSSDEEKPIEWLEDGAPADDFRKLGYQPKK